MAQYGIVLYFQRGFMRPISQKMCHMLLIASSLYSTVACAQVINRGLERVETSDNIKKSPTTYSKLQTYILNAFENDPFIKSQEAIIESQKTLQKSVQSYESPELALQMMRTKPDAMGYEQEYGIALTQMVEKPSLRHARKLAQEAKVIQAQRLFETKKGEIAGDVIEKGYILQAYQMLLEDSKEALQTARFMKSSGDIQFKEGSISQAQLLKIIVEEQRIFSEHKTTELLYLQAKREFSLAAKIDLEDVPAFVKFPSLTLPKLPNIDTIPFIQYYDAVAAENLHASTVVKLSAIPGVRAGLGFQKSYDQTSVMASLALPLPVWSRSRYNEEAANLQSFAAQHDLQGIKFRLEKELSMHNEAIEKTKLLIDQLDQTASMAQKMEQLAQKSYESGYSSMHELLDARRVAIKAKRDKLEAMIDLYKHVGFILKHTPYTSENQ